MTRMLPEIGFVGPAIAALLTMAMTLGTAGHALLHKRDHRSALGWVGLIVFVPILGACFYVVFGINRIRRRAVALRRERAALRVPGETPAPDPPPTRPHLTSLQALVRRIVPRSLTSGNRIVPLVDGDRAYPEMLAAIESAERSLTLSTFIFDNDEAGRRFLKALAAATGRGVAVRVLVDAVGARYSWPSPSMVAELGRAGVPAARFMPTLLPWRLPYLNLRNHRKVLVADGRTGFTGGMNIRVGHVLEAKPRRPVRDLHFRVEGPVVAHLQQAFAEDWEFATGERLLGETWFPPLAPRGTTCARGITDGPDEDFDVLRLTLLGALACARESVFIQTPYFLPDSALITSLDVAAMRGVRVEILLPAENNQALVHWASRALWWQLLERGCRIFLSPPPFDHAKLMIVDGEWVLFGSANWDPRSLRLNFELSVEGYDPALAHELGALARERLALARPVTLAEADGRSLPARLRDGAARLLAPFL